jgi:hypothetical protein
MSDQIWFQRVIGDPDGFAGFWMCPTPNCGGAGFTFDIFPTDPAHPANEGWRTDDEGTDEEPETTFDDPDADEPNADYDPAEPTYKQLDECLGDEDDEDDLEGEEWKHGLQPGERPTVQSSDEVRQEREREQRMYDQPDQRPRVLDWSNRPSRRSSDGNADAGDQTFREDDIPF